MLNSKHLDLGNRIHDINPDGLILRNSQVRFLFSNSQTQAKNQKPR